MDTAEIPDFAALRQAREKEHREKEEAHKKEAEEYQKDMDALERVLRMQSAQAGLTREPKPVSQAAVPQVAANPQSPASPSKGVRRSIDSMPSQFTIIDVRGYLSAHFPTVDQSAASLSPTLRRLVAQGVIAVVEVGSGSKPTTYRKKFQTQPQ